MDRDLRFVRVSDSYMEMAKNKLGSHTDALDQKLTIGGQRDKVGEGPEADWRFANRAMGQERRSDQQTI